MLVFYFEDKDSIHFMNEWGKFLSSFRYEGVLFSCWEGIWQDNEFKKERKVISTEMNIRHEFFLELHGAHTLKNYLTNI